jgi:hypothetical protein
MCSWLCQVCSWLCWAVSVNCAPDSPSPQYRLTLRCVQLTFWLILCPAAMLLKCLLRSRHDIWLRLLSVRHSSSIGCCWQFDRARHLLGTKSTTTDWIRWQLIILMISTILPFGAVFELPGGLNPPTCLLNPPPQTRCPGIPWGGQFQPPAVVNDAESPVCNDNDNE